MCTQKKPFIKQFLYCSAALVLLLMTGSVTFGQEKVSGLITSQNGRPLDGVTVMIKGDKTGTTSDGSGNYSIEAKADDILVFSSVGFVEQEVEVSGRTKIDVILIGTNTDLDEVVVIGYGTQKKGDLTGALGTVSTKSIQEGSPTNVQEALQGQVSGVSVVTTSGRPGGRPTIRVRGFTSITGPNNPLYVVDGVIVNSGNLANGTSPIDYLDPQSIESISVLKDASATAIYGSRGANGVVVIMTKKGKKGQNTLSYDGSFSLSKLSKRLKVLDAKQFLDLEDLAYKNAAKYGLQNAITDPAIKRAATPLLFDSKGDLLYETDWQKEATRTAIGNEHHISFGGGNDNTTYSAGLGYNGQQGIMIGTFADTYTGRLSVETKINNWLNSGASLNYATSRQRMTRQLDNHGISSPRQMIESLPFLPVRYPNGEFANNKDYPGMDGGGQPVKLAEQTANILSTSDVIGNIFLGLNLAKGLTFKSSLGVNNTEQKNNFFAAPNLQWVSTDGDASIQSFSYKSWQNENVFNYNTDIGENQHLSAILGASWQRISSFVSNTSVSGLNSLFYKYNNLGAASVAAIPSSNLDIETLNSYFGRVNYSFNDKYLLTLTGRIDGSSKFAKDNQYGFFPSAAFAWNISKEDFLKDNNNISELKLRLSYGETGNSQIPNYRTVNKLAPYSYIDDGKLVSGNGVGTLANSELKWERDKEFDVGFDLGLWGNRLSVTADVYYRKSSDILLDAPIPATSGYTSVIRNIGSMENRGFEFSVNSANITNERFQWTTSFNLSMNKNKVLHLVGGQDILGQGGTIIREGEPVNSFYGYTILGTYSTDQEAEAAKYGYLPGDLIFKDWDNNQQINEGDKTIIGHGLPKGEGALINNFNYKGFQLMVNMRFVFGNDIMWGARYSYVDRTGIANSLADVLDAWTPDHQNTMIPEIRPNAGYVNPQEYKSTWIYSGSFLRAQRVMLSYNIQNSGLRKAGIDNLRVYLATNNLFVITSYPGYDPEVSAQSGNFTQGTDYYAYPKTRTFQIGVSLNL